MIVFAQLINNLDVSLAQFIDPTSILFLDIDLMLIYKVSIRSSICFFFDSSFINNGTSSSNSSSRNPIEQINSWNALDFPSDSIELGHFRDNKSSHGFRIARSFSAGSNRSFIFTEF